MSSSIHPIHYPPHLHHLPLHTCIFVLYNYSKQVPFLPDYHSIHFISHSSNQLHLHNIKMEFRKSGPFVSMNFSASMDDDVTDPIVEEEAKKLEKELAKKMLKQSRREAAAINAEGAEIVEEKIEEEEEAQEGGGGGQTAATDAGATVTNRSQIHRESTESEGGTEFGPFQNLTIGSSGHVISSPYELSHYPIEIQENKTALTRQISNRLTEMIGGGGGAPSGLPCSSSSPLVNNASSLASSAAGRSSTSLGHHSTTASSAAISGGASPIAASISSSIPGRQINRRWSLQQHHQQPAKLESIREQTNITATTGGGSAIGGSPRSPGAVSPQNGQQGTASPFGKTPASPSAIAYAIGQEKIDEIDRELCSPQHVEMHTFRDAIDVNYQRMGLTGEELSGVPLEDLRSAARRLIEALRKRSEYMEMLGGTFPTTTRNFLTGKYPRDLPKCRRKNTESSANMSYNPPEPPKDHWGLDQPLPKYANKFTLKRSHGTMSVLEPEGDEIVAELQKYYLTREKYLKDFNWITGICNEGPLKTFCYRRLTFLQTHFQLHVLLNEQLESAEQRSVPHRDFYNIRKVDTHIHATSSMNHKHLLRFIKKKMRTDADEVVHVKEGKKVTMKEMFERMGITPYDLTVDMLDMHADRNTFHRFDKFNAKYNPIGQNDLRELFMKTDNYVGGRYFAEVMKEVLSDVEDSKYQHMEPRLSIYGRTKDEWDKLAKWALSHDVWSQNIRWMIQIPRLYDVYRAKNLIANFDVLLDNIFAPLFEVTNDPASHPELHRFLQHVSGLDSVDDESKHEHVPFTKDCPEPVEYTGEENPSYSYYLFYMYSNLAALNAFRRMRGLNGFTLRPHCGEAGHANHLGVAFLTAESIAHGLMLRKVPVLQYLFYLAQTGIAMSPLSNNHLFLTYQRNPMPEFLMKGLNVSLSTDDPLQFHITKEALMEEYSIAAQVWKLSSCDMSELARNSVLQSGFEHRVKLYWLGPNYNDEGVLGNDISRTNVPDIRVSFRHESLVNELVNLFKALSF